MNRIRIAIQELNPCPGRYRSRSCTGALPDGRAPAPYLRLVTTVNFMNDARSVKLNDS